MSVSMCWSWVVRASTRRVIVWVWQGGGRMLGWGRWAGSLVCQGFLCDVWIGGAGLVVRVRLLAGGVSGGVGERLVLGVVAVLGYPW